MNDWAAMCIQRRTEFLPCLNGWAAMCIQRQTTCLRWCLEGALFAMVLRRLDCLRWECSGKQSTQMVVRLFGMVLRMSHFVLRLLAMVPGLVAADFTAPSPSHLNWQHHRHRIFAIHESAGKNMNYLRPRVWAFMCVCVCACACACV